MYPGAYPKNAGTKWWDGYTNQEVVIIEDFDKYNIGMSQLMKLWLDRYPFVAETKNGSMQIRPRKVIVSSNYLPSEIWTEDASLLEAINRRVQKVIYRLAPGEKPLENIRPDKPMVVKLSDPNFFRRLSTETLPDPTPAPAQATPVQLVVDDEDDIILDQSNSYAFNFTPNR